MELDLTFRPDEGLPGAAYRKVRDAGPVVFCESMGGWLVSSYENVRAVVTDMASFTSEGTPNAQAFGAEGMLVNDSPLHHTLRAVWAKHVSKPAMGALDEEIKRSAARVLEPVRARAQAGATVDLVPLFNQYVMEFIATSCAIPRDRFDVFEQWRLVAVENARVELAEGSPAHQRRLAAKNDVFALIREQVDDRRQRFDRGEQPDDFVSLMVAAEGREGITRSTVVDNLFNFILGATPTTERWLGNIVLRLYGEPGVFAALGADRNLIGPFVDEVMRLDTVAQMVTRRVKRDGVEFGGMRMNKGDLVYPMLGAANRDPAEYENPDAFDLYRDAKPHLGFGFGFHHCLGVNIARQESIALVNVLLDRVPDLRIADCEYGDTWALWGPRALRVSLP